MPILFETLLQLFVDRPLKNETCRKYYGWEFDLADSLMLE